MSQRYEFRDSARDRKKGNRINGERTLLKIEFISLVQCRVGLPRLFIAFKILSTCGPYLIMNSTPRLIALFVLIKMVLVVALYFPHVQFGYFPFGGELIYRPSAFPNLYFPSMRPFPLLKPITLK